MNCIKSLTSTSKQKIEFLSKNKRTFGIGSSIGSEKLVNMIFQAFMKPINSTMTTMESHKTIMTNIIEWHDGMNGSSNFSKELEKLEKRIDIHLHFSSSTVNLKCIYNPHDHPYVSAIIHAVNTIFNAFPPSNNKLEILVCLNEHERKISDECQFENYIDTINCLKKKSLGMNVSGATKNNNKWIIVTRKEEVIKLLFHECVHYLNLDLSLRDNPIISHWATTKDKFDVHEAYTEFLSICIYCAYIACHLIKFNDARKVQEMYQIIMEYECAYSIYLCQKILNFYGYFNSNFEKFFENKGDKNEQPILLWEYIFLRTICLLQTNNILDKLYNQDYRADSSGWLQKVMMNDNLLIKELNSLTRKTPWDSISYLAFDIDWIKLI